MQSICECIKRARDAVNAMTVKFSMPTIVPLDLAETIHEQCEFLKALVSCSKTAEDEYKFVKGELDGLSKVREEIAGLKQHIYSVQMPHINGEDKIADETGKGIAETHRQLYDFADRLDDNVMKIAEKVEKLGENLKSFKVVLFGRTKAGKSTVREALTQGAGETIGKGRQSTTKEVQWYDWQNLKVYDTPGILSTNDTNRTVAGIGEEESKALELLQQADVAIFLFASDNIETAELDYLKDVVVRGKNVLVLLNVKADLTDYKKFLLRGKDKTITLDKQSGHVKRIRDAVRGHAVAIVPIHAQAAFFSRAKNNPDVTHFFERYLGIGATKAALYDLSHFGEIRRYLVDNILTQGRIIRCQQIREYFISNIEKFAGGYVERINNSVDFWQQTVNRTTASKSRVTKKAKMFAKSIPSKLEMAAKAEIDTYDIAYKAIDQGWGKDTISETWKQKLEDVIPRLPGPIVEEFLNEVKDEFSELMKGFDFIRDTYISDDDTSYSLPWGDLFKVGGFVAGCLSFAATVGWIPGGGWVAGGLALLAAAFATFAGWFKSKTTKIHELQEKLNSGLIRCIDSVSKSMVGKCEAEMFPRIFDQYDAMLSLQNSMLKMCQRFQAENQGLLDTAERNRQLMENRIRELRGENESRTIRRSTRKGQ